MCERETEGEVERGREGGREGGREITIEGEREGTYFHWGRWCRMESSLLGQKPLSGH